MPRLIGLLAHPDFRAEAVLALGKMGSGAGRGPDARSRYSRIAMPECGSRGRGTGTDRQAPVRAVDARDPQTECRGAGV